jgi:hypothetical protein
MARKQGKKSRRPPFTHREIARALIKAKRIECCIEGKPEIVWMPDWLKVEVYNLFMIALPQLITGIIWLVVFASIYWWLVTWSDHILINPNARHRAGTLRKL